MSRALMRVRGLRKDYPRQRVNPPFYARWLGRLWGWTGALDDWEVLNEGLPVVKGIDLDIHADETLAIVGKSGAGKSTLLHLLGALDRPSAGSVLYEERDLATFSPGQLDHWRNTTVGFVFQFYHLFPDLDALENVLLPAMVAHGTLSYPSYHRSLRERARHLLDRVGLGDREHHRPSQLSGGEQQRVAIARSLILEPKLLLCDEPTGNLDRATGEDILELLWQLKADKGQTYVVVTHDERLAERASRVVRMTDGRITSIEKVKAAPAAAAATIEVVSAPAPTDPVGGPTSEPAQEPAQEPAAAPAAAGSDPEG
ncbi:MAG: ABC transporter ATP-binding protein [Planctomycetota bacterium]